MCETAMEAWKTWFYIPRLELMWEPLGQLGPRSRRTHVGLF